MCNLLSNDDKVLNYKRYETAKLNRMKIVNMTMLSKQTIFRCVYDEDASPSTDGSAGYDSMSEVHICPLSYESQLNNVTEAENPIYLNQVHDDFKCSKYGYHPLLNAPMWLGPVPTIV